MIKSTRRTKYLCVFKISSANVLSKDESLDFRCLSFVTIRYFISSCLCSMIYYPKTKTKNNFFSSIFIF